MRTLRNYGVQESNLEENINVNGGQLGPGPNYIGWMGYAPPSDVVGHTFTDFVKGVYDGLSSLWN